MVMTVRAFLDHRHSSGEGYVAHIRFSRECYTVLENGRPWFNYPVAVVYVRFP